MLLRKKIVAILFAPCLGGCAFAPQEPVSTPALEQWAAEHPEVSEELARNTHGSAKPPGTANTQRWLTAQQHAARYETALAAWQQDDTETCRKVLLEVLCEDPQHRDSLLLLAQLEMLDRRAAAVQQPLIAYCNANPKDSSAQHMLGLVLESMGEKRAALTRYRQAADLAPENLAFQASVDGILDPGNSTIIPDSKTETEPGSTDLLATDGSASRLQISEPTQVSATAGPRRRLVDDYANGDTGTREMLAATQQSHVPETGDTSISRVVQAGSQARSNRLSSMFAASKINDIGRGAREESSVAPANGLPATDAQVELASASQTTDSIYDANVRPAGGTAASANPVSDKDTLLLTQAVELIRTGQPDKGLQLLTMSTGLERSARFYRVYGMAQFETGDAQGAATSLSKSLSLDDTSALSYFLMGASLSQLGHAAEAEGHFQQAARLDPRFASNSSAGSERR